MAIGIVASNINAVKLTNNKPLANRQFACHRSFECNFYKICTLCHLPKKRSVTKLKLSTSFLRV